MDNAEDIVTIDSAPAVSSQEIVIRAILIPFLGVLTVSFSTYAMNKIASLIMTRADKKAEAKATKS